MRITVAVVLLAVVALPLLLGCRDNTPPPRRVPVPQQYDREEGSVYRHDDMRPLPPPVRRSGYDAPPFDDPPLITQQLPEAPAFVDAYQAVGRPRMTVFMNRTMEGQLIPVNPQQPLASIEYRRQATTGMSIERTERRTNERGYRYDTRDSTDRFETTGPAEYRESLEVYLPPGEYDEATARSLDYEAMENTLTDWLAAGGRVTMVSPSMARQRLTDEQLKELQEGRPKVLSEIAEQLNADILVQVQARPTRQSRERLEIRVIAEAINTRGGQSIGRAFVDVPLPLEKTQINYYTRYLARKLMDDMTGSWSSPQPQAAPPQTAPTQER